jgi:copper chaperone
MRTQIFTVRGMSCEHCVRTLSDEVMTLPGVDRVDVDLATGTVTVVADREFGESEVAAAVEEAGYELVRDQEQCQ